jgi:hypothetical protein
MKTVAHRGLKQIPESDGAHKKLRGRDREQEWREVCECGHERGRGFQQAIGEKRNGRPARETVQAKKSEGNCGAERGGKGDRDRTHASHTFADEPRCASERHRARCHCWGVGEQQQRGEREQVCERADARGALANGRIG